MTVQSHILEPDAQAIFLLCGRLGSHDDSSAKPLTLHQYNAVANWLHRNEMRPSDLLEKAGRDRLSEFGENGKLTAGRLRSLLQRGTAIAMAVEDWTNKGGWVLARSDDDYPTRFRRRLGHLAPPILYGVGDRALLEYGGVSMVGSRDASDAALAFIGDLARRCAQEGIVVISGGARGVDRVSMEAALETGGKVVAALANGLSKTSRKKKYREAIAERQLTLISAYHPDSRFAVWKAMGRNKHIYAFGDGTVVAHSSAESGGTWAGATENLEHDWVPLFVYAEAPVPEGNRKLIEMGGKPIDRRVLQQGIEVEAWLSGALSLRALTPTAHLLPEASAEAKRASQDEADAPLPSTEAVKRYLEAQETKELFPFVWPVLKTLLHERRSAEDVRKYFDDLRPSQARDWLMQAVERGLAEREERPVRYILSDKAKGAGEPGHEEGRDEISDSHATETSSTLAEATPCSTASQERAEKGDERGSSQAEERQRSPDLFGAVE